MTWRDICWLRHSRVITPSVASHYHYYVITVVVSTLFNGLPPVPSHVSIPIPISRFHLPRESWSSSVVEAKVGRRSLLPSLSVEAWQSHAQHRLVRLMEGAPV